MKRSCTQEPVPNVADLILIYFEFVSYCLYSKVFISLPNDVLLHRNHHTVYSLCLIVLPALNYDALNQLTKGSVKCIRKSNITI